MLSWDNKPGLDVQRESDLVIAATMPGKGRAWERSSHQWLGAFSLLGRVHVSRWDSLLAHYKGLGTLVKIADLTLIRVVRIQ